MDMSSSAPRLAAIALLLLAASLQGCEQKQTPTGVVATPTAPPPAAAVPAEQPNANAARYGPHGVATTPASGAEPAREAPEAIAPAIDARASPSEMAGHACHCGASCKCGHCAGAVPGCHCKTERNDDK
jgi:hypothetical protein